jgi:hypothetical protein
MNHVDILLLLAATGLEIAEHFGGRYNNAD